MSKKRKAKKHAAKPAKKRKAHKPAPPPRIASHVATPATATATAPRAPAPRAAAPATIAPAVPTPSATPLATTGAAAIEPIRAAPRWPLLVGAAALAAVVAVGVFVRSRRNAASPSGVASASAIASAPLGVRSADAGLAAPLGPPRFADRIDVSTFQKGNIHTHTNLSDGDHPPEEVYAWYRDRGYNFLAVTDHNTLTDPARFKSLERKKRFVMIPGEEVTLRGAGKQVHVNALCTKKTIGGRSFDTQRQALTWAVQQIDAQGGVALVNHPNWDWALTADDLPAARGAALLEIASGHPYVHTMGDATHLSHEAVWDAALTAGLDFAGAAVDDAHVYGARAAETAARPGRAWIQVFAPEPSATAICDALAHGRLYASTGPSLKRIVVEDAGYAVFPADTGADVEFIGAGGRVLKKAKAGADGADRYELAGDEGYVRARVTAADGKHAWTEPSRVIR